MPDEVIEEPTEPTGTPLIVEEPSEWGNTARIVEPGQEPEPETAEPEPVEKPEPEPVTPPEVVAQPVGVEDPGEYVPKDYSFEVTTYDTDGKKPQKHKITSPEDWDDLLEGLGEDRNFGGNGAPLLKAQRLVTKMEGNQEHDKAEFEAKKQTYDEALAAETQRTETVNAMASELNYLVAKGKLPQIAKEFENADWTDPQVAKQAGVKEQLEVLSFMRDENAIRVKAGLKPMTSVIDAFNAWQLENSGKKADEAKAKAAQARKDAGAKVAAGSPNPVSVAPKGVKVGRSLGSLSSMDSLQF